MYIYIYIYLYTITYVTFKAFNTQQAYVKSNKYDNHITYTCHRIKPPSSEQRPSDRSGTPPCTRSRQATCSASGEWNSLNVGG